MMDISAADSAAPPSRPASRKVPRACQRCQRQKLKCDVQRPCILCVRAGVDCLASKVDVWKVWGQDQIPKNTRNGDSNDRRRTKRIRQTAPPEAMSPIPSPEVSVAQTETAPSSEDNAIQAAPCEAVEDETTTSPVVDTLWTSTSATIKFVEEAFHHNDSTTPDVPETSAFTASQWMRAKTLVDARNGGSSGSSQMEQLCRASPRANNRLRAWSPAEIELTSLLPEQEPAALLVDNYFDRIHWFILVFHQGEFRERFRQLYIVQGDRSAETSPRLGFLSVFLAVCLISLRYTGADQRQILAGYGVEPAVLQQQLLTSLRLRLLDVVSLGSIEAVQTCVLLGSFYLYHGVPELAWPICGCGLRIAQALNLHRSAHSHKFRIPDLDDPVQRAEETRKRCWWAVYEIETFCSMLYGFPLSISDSDCDIELLNPYASRSRDPSWNSVEWQATGQATLLSYKHSMAQLSTIVKAALTGLYGLHQRHSEKGNTGVESSPRLRDLIFKVANLDARLRAWYQNLPKQLRSSESTELELEQSPITVSKETTGISNRNLQCQLFQLQALALKLAFENARILVHRPLLSYKTVQSSSPLGELMSRHHPQTPDPFHSSIQACRDAALQVSRIGSTPIFREAADTYAVSFVSLHLFTAGVALSIMTSLQPLSQESYESKIGLRRLMEMQSLLKSKSIVAEQGFKILKKLMSLIMSKEMEKMFEFEVRPSTAEQGVPQQTLSTAKKENTRTQDEPYRVDIWENTISSDSSRTTNKSPHPGEDAESSALLEPATTAYFDVCEDPLMTQALLEFEAMNYAPNENAREGALLFDEYLEGSCFSSQDQGWIWGSNYHSLDPM